MTYNPKIAIGAAILFFLLSIVAAYFGVTRTKSLITEQTAHEETQNKLDMAEAFIQMKEAQLKRAYAKRTTSTPVFHGDKVAYIKTSETVDNSESRITEYTAQIETLVQQNASLQDRVDRLSKVEMSKSGVKRWNVGAGWLNTVGLYESIGYRQDLGLFDITISGIYNIPSFNTYGGSVSIGF